MTNEQLAEFIKTGGNDELIPILWERVHKLLYVIAKKYYNAHSDMCARCGVTLWDLKQAAYYAYLGAVGAYDKNKGYKFTAYLDLQFKSFMRPIFNKDLLNASESLNVPIGESEESDTERIDFIPDTHSTDFIEHIENESVYTVLRQAIKNLSLEQQKVINMRYYQNMTLEQIAKKENKTREGIRSIENAALLKLRNCGLLYRILCELEKLGLF